MTEKDKFLLFMSMCDVSCKKQEQMLELLQSFNIDAALRNNQFVELLSKEEYHKMIKTYDPRMLDSVVENIKNANISVITVFSEEYPQSLLNLPERPLILFAKGDLSLLKRDCIAVVGTRMPSNYGKIVTAQLAGDLARSGMVIVSGLCYGVDEIAHRKALEVGGKTIAVVGSGFNNIYPATNTALSNEIAEKGLLLSEYPPSFTAKRYTFPRRNRIVAGISKGILITEAGFKSGTIHTKEYALEYGRDIFAVPGNINNPKSELTNFMIKSGQAECVLSSNDILEFYGIAKKEKEKQLVSLNFDEQTIVDLLGDGEQNFEYLAEKSKIPINLLNSCLTTLEIRGLIKKLPSQVYALL